MAKTIQQQIYEAEKIKKIRCREWTRSFRYFVPEYVTDYLFYNKFGEVFEMLKYDEEKGFAYDPFVLEAGIDNLLRLVECVRRNEFDRAVIFYGKLAPDAETRIAYFWTFLDKLDVYAAIDKLVARDIDECIKTQTDPEFLEILGNRKRNILKRGENERIKIAQNTNRQPY